MKTTVRMFVDRAGNWLTQDEAEAVLIRCGFTSGCLDYAKVGEVYHNGGIWFQRMYDETRVEAAYQRHIRREGNRQYNDHPDGCFHYGSPHHHSTDCRDRE